MSEYNPDSINGRTRVCGLIGWPVEHTLSPLLHNGAFRALGLNFCYVPFPVPPGKLSEALRGLAAAGVVGINATAPHKEALLPHMDNLCPAAAAAGSVNTVLFREGRLEGYSTDGEGFLWALREEGRWLPGPGSAALILGAGGAARAVALALAGAGLEELTVFNRTVSRAEALAEMIRREKPAMRLQAEPLERQALSRRLQRVTLLVNTLSEDPWPWEEGPNLAGAVLACDLRYHPRRTSFMRWAGTAGAGAVMNGFGMLLGQAALAFSHFTGVKPPFAVMRRLAGAQNLY